MSFRVFSCLYGTHNSQTMGGREKRHVPHKIFLFPLFQRFNPAEMKWRRPKHPIFKIDVYEPSSLSLPVKVAAETGKQLTNRNSAESPLLSRANNSPHACGDWHSGFTRRFQFPILDTVRFDSLKGGKKSPATFGVKKERRISAIFLPNFLMPVKLFSYRGKKGLPKS